jgi:hypothetical protein
MTGVSRPEALFALVVVVTAVVPAVPVEFLDAELVPLDVVVLPVSAARPVPDVVRVDWMFPDVEVPVALAEATVADAPSNAAARVRNCG